MLNIGGALVSVPIRGLFNLTEHVFVTFDIEMSQKVSVPIRGLFNLTVCRPCLFVYSRIRKSFRPHQGII